MITYSERCRKDAIPTHTPATFCNRAVTIYCDWCERRIILVETPDGGMVWTDHVTVNEWP